MILNLETKTKEHEIIKKYLQDNVSETLADKINNGVQITKDGKQLINKKNLVGFMSYATEQARKQAEKGANSACIEDKVVFGWAIHYFEENELIGELFNLDGSKYEPPKPKYTPPKTATTITKPEPKVVAKETTLFDFIEDNNKVEQAEENELEETAPLGVEENIDMETGEIITEQDSDDLIDSFDKKLLLDISILLEDKIIVE